MRTATRFGAAVKAELLALVRRTRERTGWTLHRHPALAGAGTLCQPPSESPHQTTSQIPHSGVTPPMGPSRRGGVAQRAVSLSGDSYRP